MLFPGIPCTLLLIPSLVAATAVLKSRQQPQISGVKQLDDAICTSFADCSSKGFSYWTALQTTLNSNNPVDGSDTSATFQDSYDVEFSDERTLNSALKQELSNRGIMNPELDIFSVYSYNSDTEYRSFAAPYVNAFDTEKGVIMVEEAWRDYDEQKTLHWSEIVYHTWQYAQRDANGRQATGHRSGGPISNLKAVYIDTIINVQAKEVIDAAYHAVGRSTDVYDGTWVKWTKAGNADTFYALLGMDVCKGVVLLLNDHAVEIGMKEVSAVWTRENSAPDIWLDIEPVHPVVSTERTG
ncbi:MAG: hypothetical protein Q9220_004762 [cf. Caloplaca sp. 1 TL-2023]